MPLKITPLPLPGLVLLEPRVFRDPRGFFFESFNATDFSRAGLPIDFVQDNVSRSARGTVRGLHFQRVPHAQGKLVRVLDGEVFDVAVDLRTGSPTFGHWHTEILSADNARALYIPPGFAHGFCVTSPSALFVYKVTVPYVPSAESGLRWNDPTLAIPWPIAPDAAGLSARDKEWPAFSKEGL